MLLFLLSLLAFGCGKKKTLTLGGGPTGGTFQNFALGVAGLLNKEMPGVRINVRHSGGSIDNLLQVDRETIPMALVYAGDAYLGSKGELRSGLPPTKNVQGVARLYGAAAHLVVRQDSHVQELRDLRNRRVAIGNTGSGSALAAIRFFTSQGMWEDIIPIYIGFDMGLKDLREGNVDAVWLLVGSPNLSLAKFTHEVPIRLLDLFTASTMKSFFTTYPFYNAEHIPANTYFGQEREVLTFQDGALLVANSLLDDSFVYRVLGLLFSNKGMVYLRATDPAAGDISDARGLQGITIPLHPGAKHFWQERMGRSVPVR